MAKIENPNSLTDLVKRGAVLVDVDTSGPGVTFFFRSPDGAEHRVETWADKFTSPFSSEYDYNRVDWSVSTYE